MSGARSPRRVTVAGAVLVVLGALLAYALLKPRDYYTGTTSVVGKAVAAQVGDGQQLCVQDVWLPARTGGIRVEVAGPPGTGLTGEARFPGGAVVRARPVELTAGRASVDLPIAERAATPAAVRADVCLRPRGGAVEFYGLAGLQSDDVAPTLDGEAIEARIAMWFVPPAGERRSVLASFADIARRASVLRPGFVGPWTYWVLAFVVLPAILLGAGRLAWRGLTGRLPRRAGLILVGLVFINGAAWGLITPTFDGPDEQDHYAYVQRLAETGKRPSAVVPQQRSTEEDAAVNATRILGHNEDGRGRPPWLAADEARWRASLARSGADPPRDDGGGLSTAATHAPIYYGLAAPGYWLASGDSVFGRVYAARLVSALLGALTALFAFLAIRELAPRREGLAIAAGLLVGFQPMLGFMSGVVNNDMGANAACAAVVWLLMRGLRRGLDWRLGLALGLALALAPLLKFTAFFVYPAAALALAGMLWRRHDRAALLGIAGLVLVAAAVRVAWLAAAPGFEVPSAETLPGGASLGGGQLSAVRANPLGFASYVWQVLVPFRLPFMTDLYAAAWPAYDIFAVRGWGAFGWYAIVFPGWVYDVVMAAMIAAGVACAIVVVRQWTAVRARWIEILVLLVVAVTVLLGLEMAFYSAQQRLAIAEQGRYMFIAAVPFAAIATGACFVLGRRRAPALAGGLVAAVLVLSYASQLLTLSTFYS